MRSTFFFSIVYAVQFAIYTVDARVPMGQLDFVLDNTDFAAGLIQTISSPCYVYATGDASEPKVLNNVAIKANSTGTTIATLADLVTGKYTDTKTGVKTALELQQNVNYTITDTNPAGVLSPYYIYCRHMSPMAVFDANYAQGVHGAQTFALVMSPFPLLTLHSFDTGKSENATISVAVPEQFDTPELYITILTVTKESGNMSIVKIFGPIATIRPNRPNEQFIFSVDVTQNYNPTFTPGARLGYSSPGNSGQIGQNYYHPLAAVDFNIAFASNDSNCEMDVGSDSFDTKNASITFVYNNGKRTDFPCVGTGATQLGRVPMSSFAVNWGAADAGGILTASFYTAEISASSSLLGWMSGIAIALSIFMRVC